MNITGAELISRFLDQRGNNAVGRVPVRHVARGAARTALPQQLHEAAAGGMPLVCLAQQRPRAQIGTELWREVHEGGRIAAAAKACFHVGAAAELIALLPLAFQIALSDRPGPVVLDIPQDVLAEVIEGAWIPQTLHATDVETPPRAALRPSNHFLPALAH